MKNIAVLVHSLTVEYPLDVLDGISEFFKDKDVKLIVGQTKTPHCESGIYEYQCWSTADYLFSEQIDAVIIITGSYTSTISAKEISSIIEQFPEKIIVSVAVDLNLPNSYCTHTETTPVFTKVVKHLKDVHHCKKIAFMTALETGSIEAQERFDAYKIALKKNGIEYDENLVFHAGFTSDSAIARIRNTFHSRADVKFDALIASNDFSGIGCLKAFSEMGISIPNDLKIIGFDETSQAAYSIPTLSTMNQMISNQGFQAAEIAYRLLKNKRTPRITPRKVYPVYRQSCGCISLGATELIYKNQSGQVCKKTKDENRLLQENGEHFNFLADIDNIYSLFDIARSGMTFRKLFKELPSLMEASKISSIAVCLFDEPIKLYRNDTFDLPDRMELKMYMDLEMDEEALEPKIFFNPHDEIFPKDLFKESSGNYILHPIFSGKSNYGYLLCKTETDDFALYCIFLKIIINCIAQAYEYTSKIEENKELNEKNSQLKENNSDLSKQSITDELTKVLNRRGLYILGQRSIDLAMSIKSQGLVFFGDMDGLKKINDTYGHNMGDEAIKAQAKVFAQAFRSNDIVGRISGDEFAAIATGMTMEQLPILRQKIETLSAEISKENNFPFTLSCSLGATEFNEENSNLKDLLLSADKNLYTEKRQKKSRK